MSMNYLRYAAIFYTIMLLSYKLFFFVETQWAAGNHAEEEEKKLNIVFGNVSFKSTLPPLEESATTKVFRKDDTTTENGLLVTDSQQSRKDSNFTEYDDLREDVIKNDASPENSVDREASQESGLYKDISKSETVSIRDADKESATELYTSVLRKTFTPDSSSSGEDLITSFTTNCSEDDVRCKTTSSFYTEHVISPKLENKVPLSTSSTVITFGTSTPLWNIVKSMKQDQTTRLSPVTFTSFKTTFNSDTPSVNTESSTTAQTSENLIPVEGSVVNKLDPVNDVPNNNKSDKSKSTKHSELSSSSDDRGDRMLSKFLSTTPLTTVTKLDTSEENVIPTTLISKMFDAISVTTPKPTDSYYYATEVYAPNLRSSEVFFHSSPKYDFEEKELIPSSSVQYFDMPTDFYSPFTSWFPTVSWNNDKSSVSYIDESVKKNSVEVTTHLFPSFRESSSSTETVKEVVASSSKSVTPVSADTTTGSLLVSTQQPQLNNPSVTKGNF